MRPLARICLSSQTHCCVICSQEITWLLA